MNKYNKQKVKKMVRSLKGKNVDFGAMLAREEKVIAVTGGGDRMNARGDLIDRQGKVLKTREELSKTYNQNETNVKKVSLSDRTFGSHMERVIPGTEKPKISPKKVSATPPATQQHKQPEETNITKPSYVASAPIELPDDEFEEVVPKKTRGRRLINPGEDGI